MKLDLAHRHTELQSRAKRFDFEGLEQSSKKRKQFDALLDELQSQVRSKAQSHDLSVLKTRVLLCEIHDYFGRFSESGELSEPGKDVLDALPLTTATDDNYSESLSKIRLAIAYARTLYRRYDYLQAHQLLELCDSYVCRYLCSKSHPCLGVRGEIAYLQGRVLRQQQQLRYAISSFNSAVDLYDQRARFKRRNVSREDARLDTLFSAHKCGTILALGTGWSNYASGSLKRALSENLIPARAFLVSTTDTLNRAYTDVIFASTLRALANESSPLDEEEQLVRDALKTFVDYGHPFYSNGARMELALLCLARKRTQDAENIVNAIDIQDQRWRCSANIVRSRIARQRLDESTKSGSPNRDYAAAAEKFAFTALQAAERQDEPLNLIDALIAHSEALYVQPRSSRNLESATEELRRALKFNRVKGARNPRVDGMCHLQLARHYLRYDNQYAAVEHFSQWKLVGADVEHKSLHKLAAEIEKKLNLNSIFVIDANKDTLKYSEQKRRLQQFLLRQASQRVATENEKAAELGLTRQGLAKWRKSGLTGS